MHTVRRRAVIASALPAQAERMRHVLDEVGCFETICVSDGLSVIRQAQTAMTDLVFADAVLPILDGSAMAAKIQSTPLNVYPAIILSAVPGMCPKYADLIVETDVSAHQLGAALPFLAPQRRKPPAEKCAMARELLLRAGLPEHDGSRYLQRAIEMVYLDHRLLKSLGASVYPAIAQAFGADKRRVERAMRHVIDAAWRDGEMEAQYALFGDTIDADRGSPTLLEMIARIADILRWEGRA